MDMSIRFPGTKSGTWIMCPGHLQIFGMEFTIYGMLIAIGDPCGNGTCMVLEAGRNHEDQNEYLDMMITFPGCFRGGLKIVLCDFFLGACIREILWTIFDVRNGGICFLRRIAWRCPWGCDTVLQDCAKLPFWQMADTVSLGLLLGQVVGRWGNFFNRESFGEYTRCEFLTMQLPLSAVRSGSQCQCGYAG